MRGVSGWHIQVAIHSRDSIDHMAKQSVAKKAEIYRVLIYQLLVCVSLCIDSHFRKRNTVSHKIVNIYLSAFPINKYKEKNCGFTSHSQIFRVYMWRHIDVQAVPKRLTYSRVSNPTPWDFIGVIPVPIQHRHRTILLVLRRLDPSMIRWDSNS